MSAFPMKRLSTTILGSSGAWRRRAPIHNAGCNWHSRSYASKITFRSIQVFRNVPEIRFFRKALRQAGRTVGLVPTMGALHTGHLSLIRQAAAENSDVVVTIYVNPTQFGVHEDLDSYPKTWDSDLAMLKQLDAEFAEDPARGRIAAVFAPTTKVMYPTLPPSSEILGKGSFVTITPLGSLLEGASRPVFFRGVATVCMKLFSIVAPERVYFGQKDVQQTIVIRRMVKDFHLDTEVKIGPTARDADGLALSSRNVYLGSRRRKVGLVLSQALGAAARQFEAGKRNRDDILHAANTVAADARAAQERLPPSRRALFEVDYISLADPDTLEELDAVDGARGAVLSGAIKMLPLEEDGEDQDRGLGEGKIAVRLIDNMILQPDLAWLPTLLLISSVDPAVGIRVFVLEDWRSPEFSPHVDRLPSTPPSRTTSCPIADCVRLTACSLRSACRLTV